ncbi:MAG TPA: response regulator [Mycobacteriales bacterium]|nr:response regulator [Mycobacteriales bacterium]
MSTVLVVDDDIDIARFIEVNLRLEGFDVMVAHDGEEAQRVIADQLPDLALLDVMMPRVDGVELCRRLRSDPLTASLPVIMLTAKSLSADKVVGLTAGADDYIIKPFDTLELIARVRSTLRRNAEMRAVSPLTGLPGNYRINEEIASRWNGTTSFAVCHVDLDNFKAFNDRYGWLRGDDVITLLATSLKAAAGEVGPPVPFLGHVGGDDFVIICAPEQVEDLTAGALELFDKGVIGLHDPADAVNGYISLLDRQGNERRYPIVSVSIGVAMTGRRQYRDHREIVAVATEMKAVAKQTRGSSVAIDRRVDRVPAEAAET